MVIELLRNVALEVKRDGFGREFSITVPESDLLSISQMILEI